jgi:signal transduction histidine kinase
MIENLYKVSENTYKLLQNLLEWANTQTNNLAYVPKVLNLGEITDENIKIFKSVASSKKINVSSELNGEIEVVGDKNMINTILRNLISNAIKFTQEGGFVNISAVKKKKNVEICVKDNGTGIKTEDLKKLFTIDDHLHTKGTANENGSGLGLILCKEFVQINGGKIWAESQYGKESKFFFTLPSN